jgi:hypothetical protein
VGKLWKQIAAVGTSLFQDNQSTRGEILHETDIQIHPTLVYLHVIQQLRQALPDREHKPANIVSAHNNVILAKTPNTSSVNMPYI